MRIAIDSYTNVMQHAEGGIPMRIRKLLEYLVTRNIDARLNNKWEDKLKDFDILHVFKANIDSYNQIEYAKKLGTKVVLSSVIPTNNRLKISIALKSNKLLHLQNPYSLLKRELLNADAVIAQTSVEREFIAKNYSISRDKIHIIPNGVEEKILDSFNPKENKSILLCVGRFDRNKNQMSLIKAINGLDYECHFVGGPAIEDPCYFEECKRVAATNHNIHFHGWLKNTSNECIDLYKKAKVVCLISKNEIFGNSLIEGAACGANLVSTAALPIREWGFSNNCEIVDNVTDIPAIRNAVETAILKPSTSELHRIVMHNFSWSSIVERHIMLYKELLS